MFGNPEIIEVDLGVRKNTAILTPGHEMTDLEQLPEQLKDKDECISPQRDASCSL